MFKKRANKIGLIGILIFAITTLFFWEFAFADLPQEVFFQAKLTKKDGTTLSGTHSLTFRLYTASSGGSALWTETQSLTADASGIVSCYLGSVTSFPSSIDFNSTYYLSIEVDSDGEMSARIKIVPSLTALNSDRFDELNSTQFLRSDIADTMEAALYILGNVGIGTTSPSYNLEVSSTGYFGGDVKIGTGTFGNTSSAADLYVTGNLEVDGTLYGNISSSTGTFSSLIVTGQSDLRGDVLDSTGNLTLNDDVDITGALTVATVDTGQGANELYDMDQNVLTTSAVTFATVDTG